MIHSSLHVRVPDLSGVDLDQGAVFSPENSLAELPGHLLASARACSSSAALGAATGSQSTGLRPA
jgi:hypothetical protein